MALSKSKAEVAARHDKFIHAFAETGNAAAAATAAGFSAKRADAEGYRLLSDVEVGRRAREARAAMLKQQKDDFTRQQVMLRNAAFGAIDVLEEIASGEPKLPANATDVERKAARAWHIGAMARVQAAVAILDRAGHKPIERLEQRIEWSDVAREIEDVDASDVLSDALAAIAARKESQAG